MMFVVGFYDDLKPLSPTVKMLTQIVADAAVNEEGVIDVSLADSVACGGLDVYYSGSKIKRLSYAKPDRKPSPL